MAQSTEANTVERITAAHYVDQIDAALTDCEGVMQSMLNQPAATPSEMSSGLLSDLERIARRTRALSGYVQEAAAQVGKAL